MMSQPTQAEVEAEVRAAAIEGRRPFSDRVRGNGAAEEQLDASSIFTAADLTGALLERCAEYHLPGTGQRLYVFGLGTADIQQMVQWSLERQEPERADEGVARAQNAFQHSLKVAQVILSCRQGPTRKAKRCFSLADFEAVNQYLPHGCVNAIIRLSDDLSGDDETLGAGARRFFEVVRDCLRSSLSACSTSTAFPDGLKDTLERLHLLCMESLSHGKLGSGALNELSALEAELAG
jgi:hypothetical protein